MNLTGIRDFFSKCQVFHGQFSFPLFFSVILLAVLFGLDIATTDMIVLLGGYEQNILMALVIQYPVVHVIVKGLAIVAITLIAQFSECKIKRSGISALLIIICYYSFVIINNLAVLRELMQIR